MIVVNRLDGKQMIVNADHIVTIERTPDTMLMLSGGARLLVRDLPQELVDRVIAYRQRIALGPPVVDTARTPEQEQPGHPPLPASGQG